jgi:hypothetical protein
MTFSTIFEFLNLHLSNLMITFIAIDSSFSATTIDDRQQLYLTEAADHI